MVSPFIFLKGSFSRSIGFDVPGVMLGNRLELVEHKNPTGLTTILKEMGGTG